METSSKLNNECLKISIDTSINFNFKIMTYITFTVLIVAYIVLNYFQLKNLKRKILQLKQGEIENKQIRKLISRVQVSGKSTFAIYMFFQGLLMSVAVTVVLILMNLLFHYNELEINKFLIIFLFLSFIFTLTGIVRANTIWPLCR